ncbi:trans-acting enoyl reductase family protein [Haloprofundus sp. MHR1]|uniref:saccharopine dehydrogenase family protein n=1 Tax=Haloprofundus sp. MHR1 TaxID=2572921 RepID=UPI0010BF3F78|nr:saccharopine dehydrogenase NADP-binding domain-containing protein [Haloprofundus sp. MHR1]QCJ46096.1 saccharopine dehydrogenase [Haloprofundus sp. MHR1]
MSELVIYGSYGYTGSLVAEKAVERGLDPILVGRDAEEVTAQADELGVRARVASLDTVADRIDDAHTVLNCAGPFSETAEPMVDACLDAGANYLDITGEIQVFERLKRRGPEAEEAGVTILPGVGFDVVPTDCLAAHLAERLPEATHLSLGFDTSGSLSTGTLKTAIEGLGEGGAIREDGKLHHVPSGWKTREIDFGRGWRTAVTIPWGDVSTAYTTTGIPNIEVYAAFPESTRRTMEAQRYLAPLLETKPAKRLLKRLADRYVGNPSAEERADATVYVWGEAAADGDERVVSRLRTPHAYALTAETAILCAEKTLAGDAPPGYQTPASAFGPDLILAVPGVERTDDDVRASDEAEESENVDEAEGDVSEIESDDETAEGVDDEVIEKREVVEEADDDAAVTGESDAADEEESDATDENEETSGVDAEADSEANSDDEARPDE